MKQKTLLYSYLISIIINLAFIFSLSLFKDYSAMQSQKDDVNIQFVSLPKGQVLQRRSVNIAKQTDQYTTSVGEKSIPDAKYLTTRTYKSIIRELAPRSQDPDFIESISEINLDNMSLSRLIQKGNVKDSSLRSSSSSTGGRQSYGNSSSKGNLSNIGGNVKAEESKASINGSGNSLSGYYNMSLIKYEDNVDEITTNALYQLAGAMNRWTNVKTQVIKKQMRLDDPKLINVPIIYISAKRPFSFSERERQNLRRFFANNGFLIFSNVASSDTQKLEVANSIGFELWKVLGEYAHNLAEIGRDHFIYNSFFNLTGSQLPDILGINLNGRIIAIYEDFGYGNAWASGKSGKREPYLEMGVNIIAYALTTNPNIAKTK